MEAADRLEILERLEKVLMSTSEILEEMQEERDEESCSDECCSAGKCYFYDGLEDDFEEYDFSEEEKSYKQMSHEEDHFTLRDLLEDDETSDVSAEDIKLFVVLETMNGEQVPVKIKSAYTINGNFYFVPQV